MTDQITSNMTQQGIIPVFAPSTPNPMKTAEINLVSTEACSAACHNTSSTRRCIDLQADPAQQYSRTDLAYKLHEDTDEMIFGEQEVVDTAAAAATEGVLNKPNQQKLRRKKHRPKIVKENQATSVSNSRIPTKPKSVEPNAPTRPKRVYVRKNKTTPPPITTPALTERARSCNSGVPKQSANSCKRALNFTSENLAREDACPSGNFQSRQESLSMKNVHDVGIQSSLGQLGIANTPLAYPAYELSCGTNQILKDYFSVPEIAPVSQPAIEQRPFQLEQVIGRFDGSALATRSMNGDSMDMLLCKELYSRSQMSSQSMLIFQADRTSILQCDHDSLGGSSIKSFPLPFFPEICKRRRTRRIWKPNKTSTLHSTPYFSSSKVTSNQGIAIRSCEEKQYTSWADLDRLKKKRSRSVILNSGLDTLNTVFKEIPLPPAKKKRKYACKLAAKAVTTLPSCIETLAGVVGKRATRKRSKLKRTPIRFRHSNFSIMDLQNCQGSYKHQQCTNKLPGSLLALPWVEMSSVDVTVDGFKQLHITQKRSSKRDQHSNAIIPHQGGRRKEQNALVLYRRDGTIVASEEMSDQARRRKSKVKVDLDNETERVWKLLLHDINSEGIDGTDDVKTKWWEEERKIFRGRVESFLGRMNDVQGQRKFSPWKGSVVDSVVGVFLTQNVSDHLSSSAFMSMVAHFPVKSNAVKRTSYEDQNAPLIDGPKKCEEATCNDTWTAKTMGGLACNKIDNRSYGKEVDDSKDYYFAASAKDGSYHYVKFTNNEAITDESRVYEVNNINLETETTSDVANVKTEDVTSSQLSVVSSQNSANFPSAAQVTCSSQNLEDNSDMESPTLISNVNSLNCPTSFVALLKKQEIPLQMTMHLPDQSPQPYSSDSQLKGVKPDERKHDRPRSELLRNSLINSNVLSAPGSNVGASDKDNRFLENSQRTVMSCLSENNAGASMLHMLSGNDQELTVSSHVYGDNWVRRSLKALDLASITYLQQIEESIFSKNLTRKYESCIAEQCAGTTMPSPQSLLQEKSSNRVHEPICDPGICSCYVLEGEEMVMRPIKQSVRSQQCETELPTRGQESSTGWNQNAYTCFRDNASAKQSISVSTRQESEGYKPVQLVIDHENSSSKSINMVKNSPTKSTRKIGNAGAGAFDWDSLRKEAQSRGTSHERTENTMDSVNWEAVRCSNVNEVADTIKERGMNNVLAERIQNFLNRLVTNHGCIDLEWLRDIPPDKAKEYLLSIQGLGLKSVECVGLLTLHHLAFPVDTNVGRIAVRLGWVPLQPLPESLQLHLLELYPVLESIQKFLWPRLCKMDQHTLYELHYHMITFGKVFCTKKQPNCNACPLRGECRHFASAFASARLSLPGPEQQSVISATKSEFTEQVSQMQMVNFSMPLPLEDQPLEARYELRSLEPIVEVPASPEPDQEVQQCDIEDIFDDDPDQIPTIKLDIQQFSQNLQAYIQFMKIDNGDMCKAMIALTPEVASIPAPKLKNKNRLRTEHHVYKLPDTHILLEGLPRREQDDPCPYLLAVWTPGETADSVQPPERRCNPEELNQPCNDETCFYCSSVQEAQSKIVRATLLIPCRTAMRGSFPLNGTYFQVNEVFADHDSSLNPINVPRGLIWNLPRRTVYFGTSIPTIFRGLSTTEIQQCFYKGYVCVRGFDQKTRAPRPLTARLHFPASKMSRTRGKNSGEDE